MRMPGAIRAIGLALAASLLGCGLEASPAPFEWREIAPPREGHGETDILLLHDGRVFAAGGDAGDHDTDAVEIYDPNQDVWTTVAPTPLGPSAHQTATLLRDGRVFVVGGLGKLTSAFLYDPGSDTWSEVAPAGAPHDGHR